MSFRASLVGVCIAMPIGASGATAQDNPVVLMETNVGSITIELFQDSAPISVENFLAYVNDGFFSDTVFHRVIKGFMIQGDGFTAELTRKRTRPPIKNEATNGISNERGTIAMSRTNVVDSATAQFFTNTADNRFLDDSGTELGNNGYAVFGRVTDSMDVVDRIEDVQTRRQGPHEAVPVNPVIIESIALE